MIPKIYECLGKDPLRTVLNYAFITKKKTVATDAHVLIAYNTEELFDEDFIGALPDEGILVDEITLRDMAKKDVQLIALSDKIIVGHKVRGEPRPSYFDFKTQEQIGTFPNWEAIIPGKNEAPLSHIGINPKHLLRLQNAMGADVAGVACYFTGQHGAILVEPINSMYESITAIVMPMVIN